MSTSEDTTQPTTIPEELAYYDTQERDGVLTAKVGVAALMAAVDWLIAKELADSRLMVVLRKAVAHA